MSSERSTLLPHACGNPSSSSSSSSSWRGGGARGGGGDHASVVDVERAPGWVNTHGDAYAGARESAVDDGCDARNDVHERRRYIASHAWTCARAVGALACAATACAMGARAISSFGVSTRGAARLGDAATGAAAPMLKPEGHAALTTGGSTGVSLSGWLQLEDWFFANGQSTLVDSPLNAKQGKVLPPYFNTPEELGFDWASEGELIAKLAMKHGNEKTVKIMNAYRTNWLKKDDLVKLKKLGYATLRIPITWATFFGTEDQPTRVIADPKYNDRAFVTVNPRTLTNVLKLIHSETGARFIVDMHNMPGGSSVGTYNGVFPRQPAFWDSKSLQETGRQAIHKMMQWYNAMDDETKDMIEGFTLLNEPAHLMPAKKDVMLQWMKDAIYLYRETVARPRELNEKRVPTLYVNLIDTSGVQNGEMGRIMKSWFDSHELKTWAVLDTHFYLAWGFNGCDVGCTFSCSSSKPEIVEKVRSAVAAHVNSMKRVLAPDGIRHVVGEWSIASHHDSARGCEDPEKREAIFKGHLKAFSKSDTPNYFWGWKMPSAGKHEAFWSMDSVQSTLGNFVLPKTQPADKNTPAAKLGQSPLVQMQADQQTGDEPDEQYQQSDTIFTDQQTGDEPDEQYQQSDTIFTDQQNQQQQPSSSSSFPSGYAPARQAEVSQYSPAVEASTSKTNVVYARDRHDGSFWGTAFGLDSIKAPTFHQNSLMMDDDEDFDDTQYYEEPREVIASRTGTSLPSYADDARDQLQNSHHSTYSMHEAKHMKHKIPSYDLFENSKSHGGDDDEEEEEENDDGATISEMYDDDEEDGRKHKRKSDSDESIERAPSSHHRSHADRGDESLPTLADSMEADADDESGSSKHHKHKHSKKSDADEDDVPPWTAFANGDFS